MLIGKRRITWKRQEGQAMVEFALTLPLFLLVLFALAGFALLFYSYVTVILASREGASALVHNPKLTPAQVQAVVVAKSISLNPGGLAVPIVEPANSALWLPGVKISVTQVYTVPLPTIYLPNIRGPSFQVLGPVRISATSAMTLE